MCSASFRLSLEKVEARDLPNRCSRSQRLDSPFTRSDAHRLFHFGYKDFAVTDFPGLGSTQNGFHCFLRAIVRNHYLELCFWKEIHRILGAAINFAVPFLASKSFYFTYSHSFYHFF